MKAKTIAILAIVLLYGFKTPQKAYLPLGIIASLDKDSLVYAAGFKLNGASVGALISPSLSEEKFQQNLDRIKKSKCKIYLCNVLFPGKMKIAGPDVDEQKVLAYVDSVFLRAKLAGVQIIVLGSGTSRRIPDNYDIQKAQTDFVALCKKMAILAQKHQVKIAIENLQRKETNFLNTVKATAKVVELVNHPNFGLNADIYHMTWENEPPQNIVDAKKFLIHCEIAETEKRTVPGIKGDDFRPYLKALKGANYKGPLFIEAGFEKASDIELSFNYLSKQVHEVFNE
ncbi:MAG: sugar phosphate isomerase/epimerase [Pedobacter sp.]|nr:MAG: sugar phosphate isomerase/epimerase [Pedobacter sp.]